MKNHYEVRGGTTIIFVERKDGSIFHVFIDTNDLEKLNGLSVNVTKHHSGSYYARVNLQYKKKELLHRYLLDCKNENKLVDHINHNKLDNRKQNLRVVNRSGNQQNRIKATKRSERGIKGVSKGRMNGTYTARIEVNKKRIYIGTFKSIEEANDAVITYRKQYMPYSQEALTN